MKKNITNGKTKLIAFSKDSSQRLKTRRRENESKKRRKRIEGRSKRVRGKLGCKVRRKRLMNLLRVLTSVCKNRLR